MDVWLIVWLIVGVAFVAAEVFTTTFILLMFGIGAFAAAGAAALGANEAVQAIVFAVVSALSFVAVRPTLRRYMRRDLRDTAMGVEAIEGSMALVMEDVDNDSGMIKIDGELWRARPYDVTQTFAKGERVRVIEIKGATAMVWKD
ncbi:NfeD family protein [Dactylosporangium sp. AC04546]|uniref:NfeD family protein n=1 Tax=Dactylosporangium sp. AC04546 TaxID=2862460 RepID=UPI001EDEF1C7|nr:NfeD family protein [Dactylosporangium sp. AC04546]WVK85675.1 NfeD family protein [Dactylosporangium sp. AC04546]